MRVYIQNYFHRCGNDKIIITIEWWRPINIPEPTEEELAICPERFRCFVCQRIKSKRRFAGIIRFQYICRTCYSFIGDRTVRGLISFDLRAGFPVRGYPKRKRLKFTKPIDHSELSPKVIDWLKSLRKKEGEGFGQPRLHEVAGLVQQERLLNSETPPFKDED